MSRPKNWISVSRVAQSSKEKALRTLDIRRASRYSSTISPGTTAMLASTVRYDSERPGEVIPDETQRGPQPTRQSGPERTIRPEPLRPGREWQRSFSLCPSGALSLPDSDGGLVACRHTGITLTISQRPQALFDTGTTKKLKRS